MPRFFVRRDQIGDNIVAIVGEDAHHISRSLRMAAGEHITVCDMQSTEYDCELTGFYPDHVEARILSSRAGNTEPPYRVHLFQALTKGDKMDAVVQKSVECGVCDITPFESERCIVRLKGEGDASKLARWQRIAFEAAKQSGRGIVPEVHPGEKLDAVLKRRNEFDLAIFCYEGEEERSIKAVLQAAKASFPKDRFPAIAILIGSEGGFSKDEAARALACGWISAGLGKRILRTETAACVALSCLIYELELS
ncbi:MAG: 16S rRNA (uracil(1498)-N(3))-methyltransferase [Clostridia bacterium]|nr:16S rRNA (uracil(1498)-N(3))-methyltransferase [Clostridia bacterium]